MIILSFWISLTRISNYFHHPMDVLTGSVVGMCFAIITLMVIADVFNKRSAFWRPMDSEIATNLQENQIDDQPSVNLPLSIHSYDNQLSIAGITFK